MFTDIRLKIARFFRKNGKIIFINIKPVLQFLYFKADRSASGFNGCALNASIKEMEEI